MKIVIRFFMAALLFGLCSLAYSQDVKVNINNQDATTKDNCPYRINGICATEDIGGVDVELKYIENDVHRGYFMVLTNYNSFPVTVLWQLEYTGTNSYCNYYNNNTNTGNSIIGATGTKTIELDYDCRREWTLTGLIVRKLAQ